MTSGTYNTRGNKPPIELKEAGYVTDKWQLCLLTDDDTGEEIPSRYFYTIGPDEREANYLGEFTDKDDAIKALEAVEAELSEEDPDEEDE